MKVLGILHLPRRKVFTAIFTIIAFLSFAGYVVFPGDAFAALREGMAQLVPVSGQGEAFTNLGQDSGGRSSSRGQDTTTTVPAPRTDTNATKTTTSARQMTPSPSVGGTSSLNNVSMTTEGTQVNDTHTETFEEEDPKSLKLKILKIHARAECGSHGFKVDKERVVMPEWAQGSAPFPSELTLPDPEPTAPYFAHLTPDRRCFRKGTDLLKTFSSPNNDTKCHCLAGYHGDECGVPSPVWHAADFEQMVLPSLSIRDTARRIILAIPANHELDLVDVRSKELGDAISATLIAESDFTAAGEPKDRFVETRARRDPSFLAPQRNRTLLLRVNQFPPEGCTDGWVSDHHSRSIIGAEGIPRLHGLQDDDFFVILDADEIPKRDVIDFLRFYDGYGEPVAFRMRWFIYGFFWESIDASKQTARQTRAEAGCSVGMLRRVYLDDPYCLRHAEWLEKDIDRAREYEDAVGKRLRTLEIGSADHPAGFHCSWCFRGPLGLQVKLVSSQLADGPRWGNYEDRLVPEYLERIVKEGEWFDGSKNLASTDFLMEMYGGNDSYKDFAPSYLLQNFDEYSSYLVNPSERRNTTLMSIYRNAIKYALSNEQQRSQRPADEVNSGNNNG